MDGASLTFSRQGLALELPWATAMPVVAFLALLAFALLSYRRSLGGRGWLARATDALNARLARDGYGEWPAWLVLGGAITGTVWLALLLIALVGMVWVPVTLALGPDLGDIQMGQLRWYLLTFTALVAALGALVALPFTVLRTVYTQRQTRTAEQGHVTDQINKAVEALGAEKTVKRTRRHITFWLDNERYDHFMGPEEDWEIGLPDHATDEESQGLITVEETVPNTEVRIGAIYALERIAQDSLRDHVPIMEILTAYLRHNAPAATAAPNPTAGRMPKRPESLAKEGEILAWRQALFAWADGFAPDTLVQTALRVLGRRNRRQRLTERADTRYGPGGYRLDLRGTDLRGVDLSGLDLSRARLSGALLDGARLREAHLEETVLDGARLEGARGGEARLKSAILFGANLEGADLRGAHLEEALLSDAHLEGADLSMARLEGAVLIQAHLKVAVFLSAHLEGANLSDTKMEGADLSGAHLEGAELVGARLEGADVTVARVQAAAVTSDLSRVKGMTQEQLDVLFADGRVTADMLPAGLIRPAHWPEAELDWSDFYNQWQTLKADPEGYTPPPP